MTRIDLLKTLNRFSQLQYHFKEMVGSDERNVTYYEILVEHYRKQCEALEAKLGHEDEGSPGMVAIPCEIEV
jgi:hypothetical protein